MSYKARLVRGLPKEGSGYPTLDSEGNLTLPNHPPIPASQWRKVEIVSEAAPDLSGLGKGSVAVDTPQGVGTPPPMAERFQKKRPR